MSRSKKVTFACVPSGRRSQWGFLVADGDGITRAQLAGLRAIEQANAGRVPITEGELSALAGDDVALLRTLAKRDGSPLPFLVPLKVLYPPSGEVAAGERSVGVEPPATSQERKGRPRRRR